MKLKILLLKTLMLLDFLICGSRLFHFLIVEGEKEFLKRSCFVRSWRIFSEFREKYLEKDPRVKLYQISCVYQERRLLSRGYHQGIDKYRG